jgi:hypothetical protein
MLDQLTHLAKKFGQEAVVNNNAIPNELNESVVKETGNSMMASLQKMASEGNFEQLAGILQGNNSTASNPAVKNLVNQVSGSLGQKFNIDSNVAT